VYRIAICDDVKLMVEIVEEKVKAIMDDIGVEYQITPYGCAKELLEQKERYHLYILDVEMPEIDGMSLAKLIKDDYPYAVLIFLSGYQQYLTEGYRVKAHRFLEKPIEDEKFCEAITSGLKEATPNELVLDDIFEKRRVIDLKIVKCIEAEEKYVRFCEPEEDYLMKGPLKSILTLLPYNFAQTHRSWVVNLDFVKKVDCREKMVVLTTGKNIPLAKLREKQVAQAFENFTFGKMRGGD